MHGKYICQPPPSEDGVVWGREEGKVFAVPVMIYSFIHMRSETMMKNIKIVSCGRKLRGRLSYYLQCLSVCLK